MTDKKKGSKTKSDKVAKLPTAAKSKSPKRGKASNEGIPSPKRIDKWLLPQNVELIESWRRCGVTIKDVASNIGIKERTLYSWMSKYPEIKNACEMGREECNYIIENTLVQKAMAGNMTAIIFYLKNNVRERYSDSQRTTVEERLTEAQVGKVLAETDLSKRRLEILNGDDADGNDAVAQLMDALTGSVKREDKKDGDKQSKDK